MLELTAGEAEMLVLEMQAFTESVSVSEFSAGICGAISYAVVDAVGNTGPDFVQVIYVDGS